MSSLYNVDTDLDNITLRINVEESEWDEEDGISNVTFYCVQNNTGRNAIFYGILELPDDYNDDDYDEPYIERRLFERFKLALGTLVVFRYHGLGTSDDSDPLGGYMEISY